MHIFSKQCTTAITIYSSLIKYFTSWRFEEIFQNFYWKSQSIHEYSFALIMLSDIFGAFIDRIKFFILLKIFFIIFRYADFVLQMIEFLCSFNAINSYNSHVSKIYDLLWIILLIYELIYRWIMKHTYNARTHA